MGSIDLTYQQIYYRQNWVKLRHKQSIKYSYRKYKTKQIETMLSETQRKADILRNQILSSLN